MSARWLWFVEERFVEFMDGAVFMVKGVEKLILFVLFVSLKYSSYEGNVCVKSAFDSGIAVSLPFAV